MRKIVSKFALVAGIVLAMVFTFSCSSDGGGDDDGDTSSSTGTGGSSSSLPTPSSSSAYIPPTVPTMDEACNSYWTQAINQIANQCSNATISISKAPPTNQTYGYDCSLTQADFDAVFTGVCPQMPPTSNCACVMYCVQSVLNALGSSAGSSIQPSGAAFDRAVSNCSINCKVDYYSCR